MHEVLDWVYSIVVALFLAMLIHIFLFVPTKVSGESMYPTLTNGEYLIVSKISHVLREMPNYGDIVIIDSRTHRERSWMDDLDEPMKNYIAIFDKSSQGHNVWVKRVIGKGGTISVEVRSSRSFICQQKTSNRNTIQKSILYMRI